MFYLGNSGGPAFDDDGDCVGIAFQVSVIVLIKSWFFICSYLKWMWQVNSSAENIGYIIPTPIIHHFLRDYNMHGKYTGWIGIF